MSNLDGKYLMDIVATTYDKNLLGAGSTDVKDHPYVSPIPEGVQPPLH